LKNYDREKQEEKEDKKKKYKTTRPDKDQLFLASSFQSKRGDESRQDSLGKQLEDQFAK